MLKQNDLSYQVYKTLLRFENPVLGNSENNPDHHQTWGKCSDRSSFMTVLGFFLCVFWNHDCPYPASLHWCLTWSRAGDLGDTRRRVICAMPRKHTHVWLLWAPNQNKTNWVSPYPAPYGRSCLREFSFPSGVAGPFFFSFAEFTTH